MHQDTLWKLYDKAQKKREHLALPLYGSMEPMAAVDRDLEIERECLKPVADYCRANGVSFASLGMFADRRLNDSRDRLMGL